VQQAQAGVIVTGICREPYLNAPGASQLANVGPGHFDPGAVPASDFRHPIVPVEAWSGALCESVTNGAVAAGCRTSVIARARAGRWDIRSALCALAGAEEFAECGGGLVAAGTG
jgi:hypothetical protein